ncbi:MAG: Ldh family oxidoreductase [Anaerolineaceae bacterium]|nr:Ldh family oxidoreductase [Anaerolineaceae bacterium]
MPVVSEAELRQTVADICGPLGAGELEISRLQDHLVGSNLRGHDSHGVHLLMNYVNLWRKGDIKFGAELEVLRESPAHAALDAHGGLGQVMAWRAADIAIDKARAGAIAAVTIRNCSHIGRLGEYAEQIAAAGLIGFVTVNGQGGAQLVAPWGGVERRLSVNPFAWGIPAPGADIMVDISPTVVAGGKVNIKQYRDEPLPVGWVIDSEGRDTTDAADFNDGSLLPLSGHKGYALGVVVDVLAGALSGGGTSQPDPPDWHNATLIIAINPTAFVTAEEFGTEVSDLLDYIRSSRLRPGFSEILIPGEPEAREMARRRREGIFVSERAWSQLCALRERGAAP